MKTFKHITNLWWNLFESRVKHDRYSKKYTNDDYVTAASTCVFLSILYVLCPYFRRFRPKWYKGANKKI